MSYLQTSCDSIETCQEIPTQVGSAEAKIVLLGSGAVLWEAGLQLKSYFISKYEETHI